LTRELVEATHPDPAPPVRKSRVVVWGHEESSTETSDPPMAELLGSISAWMATEESWRRSEQVKVGLERR